MNGSNGSTATLSIPQKILVAAAGLGEPFHESDLVEAAWKADPGRLGMRTMEAKYPDLNRVRTYLVGEKGMVRRGWLLKAGVLTYTLSRQGKEEAERLKAGHTKTPNGFRRTVGRIQVPKAVEPTLAAILDSAAYKAMVNGDAWLARLTAVDAERFRFLLVIRFDHDGKSAGAVDVARACLVPDDEGVPVATLSSGRVVIEEDLDRVKDVVRWVESPARGWNRNRKAC